MKKISVSGGRFAIIDDDDYTLISQYTWTYHSAGYAYRTTPRPNPKMILMHRHVMNAESGIEVDHINGNRLDNRKSNLRFCTSTQNKANMKIRKDNTTGYKGVSIDKRNGKFQAYININGKRCSLGMYNKLDDAAKAYNKKAVELFGDFARLNKVGT
jgi:hypothetical protein